MRREWEEKERKKLEFERRVASSGGPVGAAPVEEERSRRANMDSGESPDRGNTRQDIISNKTVSINE